jgi:ABC-2 type transport system permease protein
MTLAPPGSTLWLLSHDLRLAGRDLRAAGRGRSNTVAGVLLTTVVMLHLIGFIAAPVLARLAHGARADMLLGLTLAAAGAFTLFLSKAISESIEALYQRGDLDLLLSSPLPMHRVLITRLLAIAVIAGFLPILMLLPIVNGMFLRGYFAWAGSYPVLLALALTASSAGAAITFGLMAWLGPRWTRFAARVLATVFGALSFLSTQARMLVPDGARAALWHAWAPASGSLAPHWWPARALLGDPLPIAALLIVGTGAVALTSRGLGHVYATGVLNTLALPRAAQASGVERRFAGSPFSTFLRKEWRLLVRHPGLAAQVFYQFIFLVPGAIALMRVGGNDGHTTPAGVVFLTALMTGRIAKILVAPAFEADQAQALTTTAPVAPRLLFRAKLIVTFAALAVVGGLPLVAIGWRLPSLLPAATFSCLGAATTRIWLAAHQRAVLRRPGMQGRVKASADGLLGVLIDIAWGILGAVLCFVIK